MILFIPVYALQAAGWSLLLIYVFSYVYSRTLYRFVEVERKESVIRTYLRQAVEIRFSVSNRSFFPIHYLSVIDNSGQLFVRGSERCLVSLGPRRKTTTAYEVFGQTRGKYPLGPFRIKGSDPLGLFPWEKRIENMGDVIIYPAVYPVELSIKKGLPAGNLRVDNPLYEDITRYKSLREYIPGDDPRRINWKATARVGKLFSMEFLPALSFPVLILLNLSAEEYPQRHRYQTAERAIEVASTLIYFGVDKKQSVGFVSPGILDDSQTYMSIPIRSGHAHAVTLMETLACINMNTSDFSCMDALFQPNVEIPWGCRLMYVGPPLSDNSLSRLMHFSQKGANIELFLVGSDNTRERSHLERGFQTYTIRDYGDDLLA